MVRRIDSPGQTDLSLTGSANDAPPVNLAEVEQVVAILERGGQMTAAEIVEAMHLPVNENTKRKVRAIARAARPGVISFPNSAGYKLSKYATLDEIDACIASWDSVIRDATVTKKLFLDLRHARSPHL